jgi:hypothetical protein
VAAAVDWPVCDGRRDGMDVSRTRPGRRIATSVFFAVPWRT